MMATWLADVLRNNGHTVREIDGWRTRGHDQFGGFTGVLGHHTAGPPLGNYPSLNVVVNGRPGLGGPLCNLGLARDGTWYVIAAGVAWHAGIGILPFCPRNQGNYWLIGIEAESTGYGDWTVAQLGEYPKGVAAILSYLNLDFLRFAGHLEYAMPPGRKIDPAQWPGGMNGFRAAVKRWQSDPITPVQSKGDEMYIRCGELSALLSGDLLMMIRSAGEYQSMTDATERKGVATQWIEQVTWNELVKTARVIPPIG